MIWYVYGGIVEHGDLKGAWATITLELSRPQEMLYEHGGLPYLASFDHDPTEEEMDVLRDGAGYGDWDKFYDSLKGADEDAGPESHHTTGMPGRMVGQEQLPLHEADG